MLLFLEQTLNGVQYSALLFLLSAGLTLVFGIMNVINLTHGSFYMVGAFCAAAAAAATGSFAAALVAAVLWFQRMAPAVGDDRHLQPHDGFPGVARTVRSYPIAGRAAAFRRPRGAPCGDPERIRRLRQPISWG